MKLVDMTLTDYIDILRSDSPAPGGGSVAALSGTQGCALVSMVADLTIGKEKYAAFEDVCRSTKAIMEELREELYEGIDLDTEAFNSVAAAYKMPKGTDDEKAARSKAIAEANIKATEVPYHNMGLCLRGLKAMKEMSGSFNPNAASDFGVAALNFKSGCLGAWLNVKINLPGIKDPEQLRRFENAEAMAAEAQSLAEELFKDVAKAL